MKRIYQLTKEAKEQMMDWDEAIAKGMIETVEEFDSLEEALEAYDERYADEDLYGVE